MCFSDGLINPTAAKASDLAARRLNIVPILMMQILLVSTQEAREN